MVSKRKLIVLGGIGAALAYLLWRRFRRKGYDDPILITERADGTSSQPVLVITIGAPGSGKTTWACATYGAEATIAADQWFDLFNNGRFDVTRLSEAHEWCFRQVLDRLQQGQDVVVNNTNTGTKEMFKYVAAVVFGGFPHKIVFATMPERNAKVLCSRNVHSVPEKTIKNMLKNIRRLENKGGPSVEAVIKGGPFPKMKPRGGPKPDPNVMYTGIWLDEESKRQCHEFFERETGCPLLENAQDGHLTLGFMQPPAFIQQVEPYLGKTVPLKVVRVAAHDWVQAVQIEIQDPVLSQMCQNDVPHITQAIAGPARAVCSNALLEFAQGKRVDGPTLTGHVGFFLRDRNAYPRIVYGWEEPEPEPEAPNVLGESYVEVDPTKSMCLAAGKGEPADEQPTVSTSIDVEGAKAQAAVVVETTG